MQLGFFSFAKLLMHRDLDPANWPEGAFDGNPLLDGLLAQGFAGDAPLFGDRDRLDDRLDPARIIQVIDADASQTKVIEEVRAGASLVVQGPPGTRCRSTITNITSPPPPGDGKDAPETWPRRWLPRSVVHGPPSPARGLRAHRPPCLELHSRSANKKALAQELGRTLMAGAHPLPAGWRDPARLRQTRDMLNAVTGLLHDPLPPWDEAPYAALSRIIGFIGQGARPPAIPLTWPGGRRTPPHGNARRRPSPGSWRRATGPDPPQAHVLFMGGARALDLQPTDLARLGDDLRAALAALQAVAAQGQPTLDRAEARVRMLQACWRALPQCGADHAATLHRRRPRSPPGPGAAGGRRMGGGPWNRC